MMDLWSLFGAAAFFSPHALQKNSLCKWDIGIHFQEKLMKHDKN